jgi:hypothetical protein
MPWSGYDAGWRSTSNSSVLPVRPLLVHYYSTRLGCFAEREAYVRRADSTRGPHGLIPLLIFLALLAVPSALAGPISMSAAETQSGGSGPPVAICHHAESTAHPPENKKQRDLSTRQRLVYSCTKGPWPVIRSVARQNSPVPGTARSGVNGPRAARSGYRTGAWAGDAARGTMPARPVEGDGPVAARPATGHI